MQQTMGVDVCAIACSSDTIITTKNPTRITILKPAG